MGADHLPEGVLGLQMSNLSPEQRLTAKQTLGIDAPECYVTRKNGRSNEKAFFYGVKFPDVKGGAKLRQELLEAFSSKDRKGQWNDPLTSSQDLLSMINRSPDPSKMKDTKAAEAMREKIKAMKEAYSQIASDHATMNPPITEKQISVFNNCEIIVCSDAAQVGMNLGNSSELGAYDSLGSPMAEWQRYTRCARMLPEAVPDELMGKPIMEPLMVPKRDTNGDVVMKRNRAGAMVAVMVKKKMKNPETGKLEVQMVQKRDERGRFLYDTTGEGKGLFSELRMAEPELFDPEFRDMPHGSVRGLQFGSVLQAKAATANQARSSKTFQINDALSSVAEAARQNADDAKTSSMRRQWESIVAKAEMARNQGGKAAIAQLQAFKEMKAPGSAEALITFPQTGLVTPDFHEGTYGNDPDGNKVLDTRDVERVVGSWFQQLDKIQQQEIIDTGFGKGEPPNVSGVDAKEVYLAIRSQEILTWMDTMRPTVGEDMRAGEGGDAITDEEVTNRMIDMLTPQDRSILKTKKYLVNVRKFGAGGAVGQVKRHVYYEERENPETGKVKKVRVKQMVHTGYENEALVSTDVRTRTMGRGRTVSNEQIMESVQTRTKFKSDGDFEQVSAHHVASAAVLKALGLFFDLSKIGDNLDQPEAPEKKLTKGDNPIVFTFGLPLGGE